MCSEPGILPPGNEGEHHEIADGSHQFHTVDVGLVDVGLVVFVVLVVIHLEIVGSTYHSEALQGGNAVLMFIRYDKETTIIVEATRTYQRHEARNNKLRYDD